jgi:hypothetical protein
MKNLSRPAFSFPKRKKYLHKRVVKTLRRFFILNVPVWRKIFMRKIKMASNLFFVSIETSSPSGASFARTASFTFQDKLNDGGAASTEKK